MPKRTGDTTVSPSEEAFGLWTTFLAFLWCLPLLAAPADFADRIAQLITPAKLATLSPRGAKPRVQKYVYWLATAQANGVKAKAGAGVFVVSSACQ